MAVIGIIRLTAVFSGLPVAGSREEGLAAVVAAAPLAAVAPPEAWGAVTVEVAWVAASLAAATAATVCVGVAGGGGVVLMELLAGT
jgi:hypothetical protein